MAQRTSGAEASTKQVNRKTNHMRPEVKVDMVANTMVEQAEMAEVEVVRQPALMDQPMCSLRSATASVRRLLRQLPTLLHQVGCPVDHLLQVVLLVEHPARMEEHCIRTRVYKVSMAVCMKECHSQPRHRQWHQGGDQWIGTGMERETRWVEEEALEEEVVVRQLPQVAVSQSSLPMQTSLRHMVHLRILLVHQLRPHRMLLDTLHRIILHMPHQTLVYPLMRMLLNRWIQV